MRWAQWASAARRFGRHWEEQISPRGLRRLLSPPLASTTRALHRRRKAVASTKNERVAIVGFIALVKVVHSTSVDLVVRTRKSALYIPRDKVKG